MSRYALDALLAAVTAGGQLGLDLAAAAWTEHTIAPYDPASEPLERARLDVITDTETGPLTAIFDNTYERTHDAVRTAGHATPTGRQAVLCAARAATLIDHANTTGLTLAHVATLSEPWLHAATVHARLRAAGPAAEALAATLLADRWHEPLDTLPGAVQALLTA